MLWILSIGILLKVPDEEFSIPAKMVQNDKVKDMVFQFFD